MRKLYLIAFDDKLNRDVLARHLESADGCGPWFYSMPNSLFVFSRMAADALYNVITTGFPGHGRVFVSEVPRRTAQGWIPGNHWKMMDENEVVHDYKLEFKGYWLEASSLPEYPGVCCVYRAISDREHNTVTLKEILHIESAKNLRERFCVHELMQKWLGRLHGEEVVGYSAAELSKDSLPICEMALRLKHNFDGNTEYGTLFCHGATRIVTSGQNALIANEFIIR